MIYKLLYSSSLGNFKTTSSNFFDILLNDFNRIINTYIIKELKTDIKGLEFVHLDNSLFYTVYGILFNDSDTIIESNQKVVLVIPLIFKDANNKYHCIYYNIGEVPKITLDRSFSINGVEKVFIHKTILNRRGAYYNVYVKGGTILIYCRYIIDEGNVFYIILEKEMCFIIFNNTKIDFISFFIYLGIPVSLLFKYLTNDSYSKFKQYLRAFNSKRNNLERKELLKLIKLIHLSFSLKQGIWFSLRSSDYLTLFCLEIISIYNSLVSIEYNKNNFTDIDSLPVKKIIGINNYLTYFLKTYLKKKASEIKKDIKTILFNKPIQERYLKIKANNYFNAKEYLTINPHIQCLDKTNSLAKLSQKNKISSYNSLSHTITVRNVRLSNLGFISPIDTTEGINCGITLGLTKNVRFSTGNNLEIALLPNKISKYNIHYSYINSSELEKNSIVFSSPNYRKNSLCILEVACMTKNSLKVEKYNNTSNFLNYRSLLSYSENLIPFLLYNDPARILMGARMQNQALPLSKKTNYFITTGEEQNIVSNISNILRSKQEGIVTYVSNTKIVIRDIYNRKHIYYITKFKENNLSVVNQTPIVWPGERVFCGQLLVSIQDSIDSNFTIGNNVNVAYGNFFGYNFEDSVVINRKVIYSHLFTSLKSDVYEVRFKKPVQSNEVEVLDCKAGYNNLYYLRNVDNYGVTREGIKVEEGDILVSKFVISHISNLNMSYTYILKLLGNAVRFVKNQSLSVPQGGEGRVVKTEVFSSPDYRFYLKVRFYIIQHRLLKVGDKLCGFYGNKGVISYIISNKDVIYTANGSYPDLITDAVGVPSRMNLGQLFENLFGLNCVHLGIKLSCINYQFFLKGIIKATLYNLTKNLTHLFGMKKFYNCYGPGKLFARNGLTGYSLKEPTFFGVVRYFKLLHMVDDKMHYRTIGPYTEIIQQPSKGKNNNGGQRFGEMEIWALQAYGNSYTIRELLTYKSDDIVARNSIVSYYNNQNLGKVTISEAFNNFTHEIHSLSLLLDKFITSKQIPINRISTSKLNLI